MEDVSEAVFLNNLTIRVGYYLIEHAKAAFTEMGSIKEMNDAKYVLCWIEKTQQDRFTKRDAHYIMQGRFKKVAELDPALNILQDHNYIRELKGEEQRGPGRKPIPVFEVNCKNV